eukprot:g1229.t1
MADEKDAWNVFKDDDSLDSSSEEEDHVQEGTAADAAVSRICDIFVDALKIYSSPPKRTHSPKKFGVGLYPPKVLFVNPRDEEEASSLKISNNLVRTVLRRLDASGRIFLREASENGKSNSTHVDAIVGNKHVLSDCILQNVAPGGRLIALLFEGTTADKKKEKKKRSDALEKELGFVDSDAWIVDTTHDIFGLMCGRLSHVVVATKRGVRCNTTPLSKSLFLASRFDINAGGEDASFLLRCERDIAERVTVTRSTTETYRGTLSHDSEQRAIKCLIENGIVIIPRLFCRDSVVRLGKIALSDMTEAITLLRTAEGIDLLDPTLALKRPIDNYHEVSTREALRCDLRRGPRMGAATAANKHSAAATGVVFSKTSGLPEFCADLPAVVSIVESLFNPTGAHASGNWGKYNFGGKGPGTRIRPRIGAIGSVISFSGSTAQAIHADTPHLLDSFDALPPHYVNLFCPAIEGETSEKMKIGQTAFVVGSHKMSCSARLVRHDEDRAALRELRRLLFRPHLEPGDALLFDTRILHFGLPNGGRGRDAWRPVLYVNYTQPWFDRERTDKNWGRKSIFQTRPNGDGGGGAPSLLSPKTKPGAS